MSIDHQYTREPVCPHCGHVKRNAWELGLGDFDQYQTECGECDKPYMITAHIRRTYTTAPQGESAGEGGQT